MEDDKKKNTHPLTLGSPLAKRYFYFKQLLASNNRALEIISDLEQIIHRDKPFSFAHVLMQSELLMGEVFSIVEDLNAMSGIRFPELFDGMERISAAIFSELRRRKRIKETGLVLPLERLSLESSSDVGGKAANLGEVYNNAHLPVPTGFAVTAYSYQQFMDYNGLTDLVEGLFEDLDVNDTETLLTQSAEIRARIMKGALPPELEDAILSAARDLRERTGEALCLSVRSSATGEDSEASFAGQHSTVLNVPEAGLIAAYKRVLASTYNPRAIYYRRRKGYLDTDVIMGVLCVRMIDAVVSGVMYTADPTDSRHNVVMISAVWGLAVSLVEGLTASDFFQINKASKTLETSRIAPKSGMIRPAPGQGVIEEALPRERKNRPCLDSGQIPILVDYGLKLERHYGCALDVEWAIDREGRVIILQARPLRHSETEASEEEQAGPAPGFPRHRVLLRGGSAASGGTASGWSYRLESDHMMHHIPEGAIVITPQTSPRYVPIMGRIRAIVTDVGSVTGHMASLAREFNIPALVGTGSATRAIPHGEEITVDATHGVVYQGRLETLSKERREVNPMKGSPIYRTFQAALKHIAPLYLTNPKRENFSPGACRTIHDVIRFSHEMAMRQMFRIGAELSPADPSLVPLKVPLPIGILVLDLEERLRVPAGEDGARIEQITSTPFRALLAGMAKRGVPWPSTPPAGGARERKGDNCAITGKYYLNINLLLGDDAVTLDTYCGPEVNDNYIAFYFKGGTGAAGGAQVRVEFVAMILRELGFKVTMREKEVTGDLKKYLEVTFQQKLDMLGRLLGALLCLRTRLSAEHSIDWYVDQFFLGNYAFDPRAA